MDDKKLAKLIDGIVKLRLEKILKSDNFKNIIKEYAQKEVIKILLEANGGVKPQKKSNSTSLKRTVSSVLGENNRQERNYPKLPNRPQKTFSKNPALNAILSQTAGDPAAMASYNNMSSLSDLVDGGSPVKVGANNILNNRISVDQGSLQSEALALAQSELSKYGMGNVRQELDTEPRSSTSDFKDMFNEQYIEYNEDISNVDASTLIENNTGMEHVARALTRDYSQLLKSADEKAKEKRPVL